MLRVKQGMKNTKGRTAGDETQRLIKILIISKENISVYMYVSVRMETKT